jgi:hypothetical protein
MKTRIHGLLALPDAVRKGDFVQEHGLIARETMDVDDANATLAGYSSSEAARS